MVNNNYFCFNTSEIIISFLNKKVIVFHIFGVERHEAEKCCLTVPDNSFEHCYQD